MTCLQHFLLRIVIGNFNINYTLVKQVKKTDNNEYIYSLTKEFEQTIPISWQWGSTNKKYYAINLALDMFHDIIKEIIKWDNITIHTADISTGLDNPLLYDSDLDSNWDKSDSDSEGQSHHGDACDIGPCDSDFWDRWEISDSDSEGPSDHGYKNSIEAT